MSRLAVCKGNPAKYHTDAIYLAMFIGYNCVSSADEGALRYNL